MRPIIATVILLVAIPQLCAQDSVFAEFNSSIDILRKQAQERREKIEATFSAEVEKLKAHYAEKIEAKRLAAMQNDDLDAAIELRETKKLINELAVPLDPPNADISDASETKPKASKKSAEILIQQFAWKQGQPPTKMIHTNEGFCFLAHIHGMNNPKTELAEIYIGDDGFWYLKGHTHQNAGFLFLRAMAIPYSQIKQAIESDAASDGRTKRSTRSRRAQPVLHQ